MLCLAIPYLKLGLMVIKHPHLMCFWTVFYLLWFQRKARGDQMRDRHVSPEAAARKLCKENIRLQPVSDIFSLLWISLHLIYCSAAPCRFFNRFEAMMWSIVVDAPLGGTVLASLLFHLLYFSILCPSFVSAGEQPVGWSGLGERRTCS